MKEIKYPKEIVAIIHTQQFCVNNELYKANEGDDTNAPLTFYSTFSRFVFSLISEKKESVTANVDVKEIAEIINRTRFAHNKHMEEITKPKNSNLSPAYTVKLTGRLKGKTPAEVLATETDGGKILGTHYEWLKENLNKYPKNQIQMDAIMDASNLVQAGTFNADNITHSAPAIPIYEARMRPLFSRGTNEHGKNFIYEIFITWNPGEELYPVNITIENYYAPVTKDEKTKLNIVNVSAKENSKKVSMGISSSEWNHTIKMIETNMMTFEMLKAQSCYREAIEADKMWRQPKQ